MRDFANEIRKGPRTRGLLGGLRVYKHTRPSEKKIPLPIALLLKSSAHVSVCLQWAMIHDVRYSESHTACLELHLSSQDILLLLSGSEVLGFGTPSCHGNKHRGGM
jgi:hypothetical protein